MQHDLHLRWFRCVGGGRGTAGGRCWTRRRRGPGQHHLEETIAHSSKQRMRSVLRQTTSYILFRKNVSDTNKYFITTPHVGFSTFSWAKITTALRRKQRPRRSTDGHTLPSAGETHGRRQRRPLSRRRSTTDGGVARRCYDDPKTSQRRVGKMWIRRRGEAIERRGRLWCSFSAAS